MNGQMYQNPGSPAAKWLFFGFILIVLLAFLVGLNLKDATWLNPSIGKAQAKSIEIEAAHQRAAYELQEQLAQAKTEAEIKAIQREQKSLDTQYEYDMKALAQKLEHSEILFKTLMTATMFIALAIAAAIVFGTIIWVSSKAIANVSVYQGKPQLQRTNGHGDRQLSDKSYSDDRISQVSSGKQSIFPKVNDPARVPKGKYENFPRAGD